MTLTQIKALTHLLWCERLYCSTCTAAERVLTGRAAQEDFRPFYREEAVRGEC